MLLFESSLVDGLGFSAEVVRRLVVIDNLNDVIAAYAIISFDFEHHALCLYGPLRFQSYQVDAR